MQPGYIEIDDICHLDRPDEPSFSNINWRESYYFNLTDPGSGISLITTLGMVPNKKRTAGFVLLIKDGRTILLHPVATLKRPSFSDWVFSSGGLSYSVEGANWRIVYDSKRIGFDIVFTPLNEIYPYTNGKDPIECIATQHYEQAGSFTGEVRIKDKIEKMSGCYGHRDHSWGIRDWSGIDDYALLSCTFSDELAINAWKSSIGGRSILKGYVFDGKENVGISRMTIDPFFSDKGRPVSASVEITDLKGRDFQIGARVGSDHIFPPSGSIVHETISEMRTCDLEGHGLLEFLRHANFISRLRSTVGLASGMVVAECR